MCAISLPFTLKLYYFFMPKIQHISHASTLILREQVFFKKFRQ